jgi:branched-chain amino acid transport system substrate-binding protein
LLLSFPVLAQAGGKQIRIGLFAPLSGPAESSGRLLLEGAALAVEQINRQGGIGGAKVKLIAKDDASDPKMGVQALRDLADKDRCVAVIGTTHTASVLASMPIANEKQIPLLIPNSSPEVTRRGNKWVFRVGAYDQLVAACMASFAIQELRWQKIVLLHENDELAAERMKDFSRASRRLGVAPVSLASFDRGERDFTVQISKVLKKQPDGIAVWGRPTDVAYLVKELRYMGYRGVIIGSPTLTDPSYIQISGEAGNNTVFANPLPAASRVPLVADFFEAFQTRFGYAPTEAAACGYDAIMLLTKALQGLTFRDRKAIRDSLFHIENCELTQGLYSFRSSPDDGLKSLPLATYLNQRLILMRDQYRPDPRTLRP